MHEHDDRRIGAREVLRVAILIAARAHVTAVARRGALAAHAAVSLPAVPVQDAACKRQQGDFVGGQRGRGEAQVLELAVRRGQRAMRERIG